MPKDIKVQSVAQPETGWSFNRRLAISRTRLVTVSITVRPLLYGLAHQLHFKLYGCRNRRTKSTKTKDVTNWTVG